MFRVGLTGGIACGKSTVCQLFQNLQVSVIDADRIAHEVVAPGTPGLALVVAGFGTGVVDSEGKLERAAMRQLVFADPAARKRLEAIVHPLVRAEMNRQVAAAAPPYCILDIPLLLETGLEKAVDSILVVDLPVAAQRYRLRQRDQTSDAQIDDILAVQVSRKERLAAADNVIDNAGPIERLPAQVQALHRHYQALANPQAASV